MNLLIRRATRADLPALLAIEQECFPHSSWKAEDLIASECLAAAIEGQLAGFLVSKQVFAGNAEALPEREILNLAVRPCFRRLGIASALLRQELSRKAIFFLEVRESNVAAQTLYNRFGFGEVARRPEYYHSPVESAIVMRMKWC